MRETLFNWLHPLLPGAACLDLFAGSGVLGFEAASRGAGRVVLVESAYRAVRQLQENTSLLGLPGVQVIQADAMDWLRAGGQSFDIVFLDPPFADGLLLPACRSLLRGGWIRPGGFVYLEADARRGLPNLPDGLELEKSQRMGDVVVGLARYQPGNP
jgi:16S rRNA (guanine966-N2)-methyltransferase